MDLLDYETRLSFRFPVYFTRDVFASSNTVLLKAAPSAVAPKPARILFVVDDGGSEDHPNVLARIKQYCRDHGGALDMAGPIITIPGGEAVKNDRAATELVL